jgi:hypothetical protein
LKSLPIRTDLIFVTALSAALFVGCGDDPKGAELAGSTPESAPPADYLPDEAKAIQAVDGDPVKAIGLPALPEVQQSSQPVADPVQALGDLAEDEMGQKVPLVQALNQAVEHFQMNAQMMEQAGMKVPQFTNVYQLVQFGLIKAVPKAPEGKKFDVKDGKVILTNL